MRRAALVLSVLLLGACSSSTQSAPPSSSTAPSSTAPSSTSPSSTTPSSTSTVAPSGSITVFAAASLTGAFTAAKSSLAGVTITYDFAGSNALVAQIQQGAPADVFASADQANMQKLVTAGLVDPPVTFARNKLEIAVAPGNPKHITGLADLGQAGISVELEAPGVPAGDYARQVLQKLGVAVNPKSLAPDVKTAITGVTSGEVDAAVVYVTDVAAAGPKVTGVMVPDADQPAITYRIAVVKGSKNAAAAQAFVTSAVSGDVQKALQAAGFIAP